MMLLRKSIHCRILRTASTAGANAEAAAANVDCRERGWSLVIVHGAIHHPIFTNGIYS